MGLSLLAGCDNEKQQIFKEAEKDLEQGSYEYALDEFTTSVNNGVKPAVSYRGIGICQLRLGNYVMPLLPLPVSWRGESKQKYGPGPVSVSCYGTSAGWLSG